MYGSRPIKTLLKGSPYFQSEVCIKTQSSGLLGLQLGPETRQMREIPTLRIWMWVRDPRRSPAITTKKGMKNS